MSEAQATQENPSVEDVLGLLSAIQDHRRFNRLEYYAPYPFQIRFHHAKGAQTDTPARQRALMCANQIGKTTCGGFEVALHATGRYPDWWEGIRFDHAPMILCGSNTNEQTRDNVQAELCGDPSDDALFGTGTIPKELLGEKVRKTGIPNALDSVSVRHTSGGISTIRFRAYEQGAKKHMGSRIDLGWMDEEPPQDIFSQYLRGTFSTGGYLFLTFTPEEGVTEVVYRFMNDLKRGQALLGASWEDAPHMTAERRKEFLDQVPAHERDMRARGIPIMGSGLVFPVPDDELIVEPFQIPTHWSRIVGLDIGWEHPTAAVWLAWDRDANTTYVYRTYRETKALISVVASSIKASEPWIPVAWPHDGMIKDKTSGRPIADLYRAQGVNMLIKPFSNPAAPGKQDGEGGQGVEAGIMAMIEAMEEGRFKVFSSCPQWFEEKQIYHRKDGQIVKSRDDLMAASRYAYQSRRYSATKTTKIRHAAVQQGMSNW